MLATHFASQHSQTYAAEAPTLLVGTLEDSIMSARQADGEAAKGHFIGDLITKYIDLNIG